MKDVAMKDEQTRMQRIIASSLICASFILLSACQQPITYLPPISEQEVAAEAAYEQQQIDMIKARGGLPKLWRHKADMNKQFIRVADRLEETAANVCRDMGLPSLGRSCYFYFSLSTDREINASSDGKAITIPMGMMRFVKNDDELAQVMGHEIAHNLMAHKQSKTTNAAVGEVLGKMIDQMTTPRGIGVGAETGKDLGLLVYSPAYEREADYVGTYIAARAGYDVRKACDFWRRFSYQEPDSAGGGLTHPANAERFVSLNKTIDEIEYKRKHRLPLIPDFNPQT